MFKEMFLCLQLHTQTEVESKLWLPYFPLYLNISLKQVLKQTKTNKIWVKN